MSDLVAFLRKRLDEDEAAAKAILEDPDYAAEWHEQSSGVLYVGPGSEAYPLDGLQPMGDSRLTRFIAEHDPKRELREVEAKRAILSLHYADDYGMCVTCLDAATLSKPLPWPCSEARAVAAVYADHPDYDEAWKP